MSAMTQSKTYDNLPYRAFGGSKIGQVPIKIERFNDRLEISH